MVKYAANYTIYKDGATYYAMDIDGNIDYSGATAHTVINSAIGNLGAAGGTVRILDGNFTLTGTVNLASKVKIVMSKHAVFTMAANIYMFDFNNVQDAGIFGGYLQGSNDYIVQAIRIYNGSKRNTVSGCYIRNCRTYYYLGGRAITIEDDTSAYNSILDNIIEDTYQEGMIVYRSSNNIIKGNTVNRTGNHGIIVTGGSSNLIENNIVLNAGYHYLYGDAHGIDVDGVSGTYTCQDNRVIGNIIKTTRMTGIQVADGAHRTAVIGNSVEDTTQRGIYYGGTSASSSGGVIVGNNVFNASSIGIFVEGTSSGCINWMTVADNVVESCGDDGIILKYVYDSTVEGNICQGNSGCGLNFESQECDYDIILGNDFRGNTGDSIRQNGANGNGEQAHNIT